MQNDIKSIKNETDKTKMTMNKNLNTRRTYKILR